jgi:hypothetical protein
MVQDWVKIMKLYKILCTYLFSLWGKLWKDTKLVFIWHFMNTCWKNMERKSNWHVNNSCIQHPHAQINISMLNKFSSAKWTSLAFLTLTCWINIEIKIVRLTNACAINIGIGKNTIKGFTQVSGHFLKLYFCMNNWKGHKWSIRVWIAIMIFQNIFH